MGRRRRKVIRTVRRTLPKIFICPRCGVTAVRASSRDQSGLNISCGSCNLSYSTSSNTVAIDLYNEFVDKFMKGEIKT